MNVMGFDFGTTNSLVSIIKGGRAINFLDKEGLPIPSVICYEGSRTIVGREAKERLSKAGLGVQGNVVRSPKILLGQESVFIEGIERSPVDLVSDVIKFVCEQARSSRRGKDLKGIDRAVVTIPVNMEGHRRAQLRDAFRLAGVSVVQFIHEPHAAHYGYLRSGEDYEAILRRYDRKLMLVFDWGGGTVDLTLCRLTNGMLVQVANDGTSEVGGDIFDETLKNEVVRRVYKARELQDSVQTHPDAMTRLLHHCERAKIDLSDRMRVELYVGSFFRGVANEELDFTLSREEMEKITAPLLDKGISRITDLLAAERVSTAQIALCLATGGMANMPAIRSRLHELFGPQRVHLAERSGTLIAEGSAWIAHDEARLRLAKHVELLLARNSFMQLVKSGTEMPREGEVQQEQFHLYCADPRDGYAKLQLQAPARPGSGMLPNDRRNPLETLVVKVDRDAQPFRERLELDIQIDDNLVLHAQARSINKKDLAEAEVHNLEFGLALPGAPPTDLEQNEDEEEEKPTLHDKGAVVLRSNVADRINENLVPGELLLRYNSTYFDRRNDPPQIQASERNYYKQCDGCGRDSNDPLCHCDPTHPKRRKQPFV
jgi:molecular chaperone DnaK